MRFIKSLLYSSLILLMISCKKDNLELSFKQVGFIEDLHILDVYELNDSVLVFCGKTKEGEGRIGLLNTYTTAHTISSTPVVINDISQTPTCLWACGDNMTILKSYDLGKSWEPEYSFDYFWENDKSNFTELFALGNIPIFAIGSKSLLNGNYYRQQPSISFPFYSSQLQMGVHDMLVIDSTQVFLAGYGSILHVQHPDSLPVYTNIGGEDFRGICLSGTRTLVTCSGSGNFYVKEIKDSVWNKTYSIKGSLQYISADSYGNIMASGNQRIVYLSKDYGATWVEVKFSSADNISCIEYQNNYFWVGTDKGEIIRFDRTQLN